MPTRDAHLDTSRLEKVRTTGAKTIARCPACAELGEDKAGDHLVIDAAGRFGCVKYAGTDGAEHRKRIFALAGVPAERETYRAPQRKARAWATAEAAASACTPPGATLAAVYLYPRGGAPFAAVARYAKATGKTFLQFHVEGDRWQTGEPAGPWPLYGVESVPESGALYVCEGEKAHAAAASIGLPVVTSAGGSGAKAAAKSDWRPLAGREVCILPDADEPGESYARTVAAILAKLDPPARVRVVRLPGLPEAGDIADYCEARDAAEPATLRAEIEALAAEPVAPAPDALPLIVDAATFTAASMPEPAQVVHGVLHRGSKAVYGGPSKAFKSWALLDLCLAVSTGGEWLDFKTTAGPVLYLNFELQPFAVHKRLLAIAQDRRCDIPHALKLWNLRGFGRPLSELLPDLLRQIKGEEFALIVPDPIYKTLNGRDENAAGDIGALCGELDRLAVETGAAVAFGAHFAKGNAAGKEHLDRVSGSGVWARDPDAIITATTHEQEGAFAVEMTLRNFAPVEPFVIRWDFPRMRRDGGLDPQRLKLARGAKTMRPPVDDYAERAVELVHAGPLAVPVFRAKLQRLTDTRDRARDLLNFLVAEGRLAELHERGKGKHEAWIGTPEQIAAMKQRSLPGV